MSSKRIIVVDDSLTIRKMIEMGLKQDGFEVITTKTGEECLAAATESVPDLILVDFMLPDMQATELCQWLRQSAVTREVPVLIISGDGDAARQLYQDAENVADYLTKPFAPSVLKAVVKNLLTKAEPDARMKSTIIVPGESDEDVAPATESGLDVPDKLMKKFDEMLRMRLAAASTHIPLWEASRAGAAADAYYVEHFAKAGLLLQISRDMMSVTRGREDILFRFKTDFMAADAALIYLDSIKATGMFRIEIAQENILVFLDAGRTIAITSNDARAYCKGASVDFRALPQDVVMSAVAGQRASYIPFYVSLHLAGHLPDAETFHRLLREQGEACMARAFATHSVACSFIRMEALPELVTQFPVPFPLPQLLLLATRVSEDTEAIAQTVPHLDMTVGFTPRSEEILAQVSLQDLEDTVLKRVTGEITIHSICLESQLPPQDVVGIIHRFVKIGVLSPPVPATSLAPQADETGA